MAGRTILAVVAHPDDAELTCAGSLARWASEGDRVFLLVAADGARGGKFRDADEAMVHERRTEQGEAATLLGIEKVIHLGFPDGELEDTRELRGALVREVRWIRPDIAVAMDPLTVIYRDTYVNHRDHRMLGIALLDALYPEASNAGYFPEQIEEGLSIHKVPELLLVQSDKPNFWVDVSDTLDLRFDALRRHRSQLTIWPENGEAVIREQREVAEEAGRRHGVHYAEEYRRVLVNPLS